MYSPEQDDPEYKAAMSRATFYDLEGDQTNAGANYEAAERRRSEMAEARWANRRPTWPLFVAPVVFLLPLVSLHDLLTAEVRWLDDLAGRVPEGIAEAAHEHWWGAVLVGIAIWAPFAGAAVLMRLLRARVGDSLPRRWFLVLPRWLWFFTITAIRGATWVTGVIIAWEVGQVLRGGTPAPLMWTAEGALEATLLSIGSWCFLRAFFLMRQHPPRHT
ncbi:hypothetical protein [Demequina mangrovi]|uniref:Uncharacterized protein n=1 Tax=Demequina mangrovi TaxID=1043493 RepID=A0A1H6ZYB8_9MICO|nr:hypothetical protein [Demequina mangrovi]SEJ58469.1 hypothetical protein SAMN05421637_2303 [Demequina mangrovi]